MLHHGFKRGQRCHIHGPQRHARSASLPATLQQRPRRSPRLLGDTVPRQHTRHLLKARRILQRRHGSCYMPLLGEILRNQEMRAGPRCDLRRMGDGKHLHPIGKA